MPRLVSIIRMAVEIALWAISLGSLAAFLAVLQKRDWLSGAWALGTLTVCGVMVALRKKKEKRLMFVAAAFIPYALVSLVAAVASFFVSAGWDGYGIFGFYLVPVVVIAISHVLSIFGYAKEPIQPPETTRRN